MLTSRELRRLLYQEANAEAGIYVEHPTGGLEIQGFDIDDDGNIILKTGASQFEKDDIV